MKKLITLICIIIILLTGCSYVELNNLAIANAIGIDYEDGLYNITVQILDLNQNSNGGSQTKTIVYEGKGKTITNAFRNVSLSYPKMLYLGHLKLAILGNTILESEIETMFDYFLRSPSTRNDFEVLINPNGSAKDILNKESEKPDSTTTKEILESLETSRLRQGTANKVNMEELISLFLENKTSPVLTAIETEDKKNKLTGMVALDSKNKKIIKLKNSSVIAYNLINNNFFDIDVNISYEDTLMDILLLRPKNGISVDINGNSLIVNINVNTSAQPAEIRKDINLEDKNVQNKIQNILNEKLKEYINDLIDECKKNNIDILGLEKIIYKNNYKDYDKFKDKNLYEIADFNLNINTKLFRYGNLYRSTKGD